MVCVIYTLNWALQRQGIAGNTANIPRQNTWLFIHLISIYGEHCKRRAMSSFDWIPLIHQNFSNCRATSLPRSLILWPLVLSQLQTVMDPGFPRGGAPTYYLVTFFSKTAWTRMHSSRMRTAHSLPMEGVCTCPGGCVPVQGRCVPTQGWCTCWGVVYLPRGVVYLLGGGVPAWEVYLPRGCTCAGVYLARGCTWLGGVPS